MKGGQRIQALLIFVAIVGFLTFQFIERFPEMAGPLPALSALQTVTGPVTRIRDGDTIEVDSVPIRFGSLDCAESRTYDGQKATDRLKALVEGQTLTCHLNGRTSHDRSIGRCITAEGQDVASFMIAEGFCDRFW